MKQQFLRLYIYKKERDLKMETWFSGQRLLIKLTQFSHQFDLICGVIYHISHMDEISWNGMYFSLHESLDILITTESGGYFDNHRKWRIF